MSLLDIPSRIPSYLLFCIPWYLFSSMKNNMMKQALRTFDYPVTITALEFICMGLCGIVYHLYHTRRYSKHISFDVNDDVYLVDGRERILGRKQTQFGDRITLKGMHWMDYVKMVGPVSFGSIVGHLFNQYAMIYANVSFIHTIKATSPIFVLVLSYFLLKKKFSQKMLLSLVPIIIGVTLSSLFELNFQMNGFMATVVSTFIFSFINVYSKVFSSTLLISQILLIDKINGITYLFFNSAISACCLLPFCIIFDAESILSSMSAEEALYNIGFICMNFIELTI
eukprot:TRINITY_DN3054_c0_g1_i1.p1 TRINITY_DN3054_c0_g1~~TRINITY_DN3054_c0_g1_i1.p1  ORF type:complete len:293 (+),score=28.79 TRINITY_DN3054_c0_g1_i1:32-880(+)